MKGNMFVRAFFKVADNGFGLGEVAEPEAK